jgi:hypothetical protein
MYKRSLKRIRGATVSFGVYKPMCGREYAGRFSVCRRKN